MNRPDMTEDVKSKDYTNKSLQTDSNPVTMEVSGSLFHANFLSEISKQFLTKNPDNPPAKESSDKAKAVKHEPLVYRVEEIAQLFDFSPCGV